MNFTPGSNSFTYSDDFADDVKKFVEGDLQYFLESKFELLDAPEEWFYDKDAKMLYLIMPDSSNACPETDELRGRTLDNVIGTMKEM